VGPGSIKIGAGNCEKTTRKKKIKIFLQKPPNRGFFMRVSVYGHFDRIYSEGEENGIRRNLSDVHGQRQV
jgi:hypothetical protein